MISTHTPVRVWPFSDFIGFNYAKFQLTHPWGCDRRGGRCGNIILISTHTPVRVWRKLVIMVCYFVIISTHTPVRVWPVKILRRVCHTCISTHTPVRVWLQCINMEILHNISTHTPVRVWHYRKSCHSVPYKNFNSHTREGVTNIFQTFRNRKDFNSHTREGVTTENWLYLTFLAFQLTHPWGCDISAV